MFILCPSCNTKHQKPTLEQSNFSNISLKCYNCNYIWKVDDDQEFPDEATNTDKSIDVNSDSSDEFNSLKDIMSSVESSSQEDSEVADYTEPKKKLFSNVPIAINPSEQGQISTNDSIGNLKTQENNELFSLDIDYTNKETTEEQKEEDFSFDTALDEDEKDDKEEFSFDINIDPIAPPPPSAPPAHIVEQKEEDFSFDTALDEDEKDDKEEFSFDINIDPIAPPPPSVPIIEKGEEEFSFDTALDDEIADDDFSFDLDKKEEGLFDINIDPIAPPAPTPPSAPIVEQKEEEEFSFDTALDEDKVGDDSFSFDLDKKEEGLFDINIDPIAPPAPTPPSAPIVEQKEEEEFSFDTALDEEIADDDFSFDTDLDDEEEGYEDDDYEDKDKNKVDDSFSFDLDKKEEGLFDINIDPIAPPAPTPPSAPIVEQKEEEEFSFDTALNEDKVDDDDEFSFDTDLDDEEEGYEDDDYEEDDDDEDKDKNKVDDSFSFDLDKKEEDYNTSTIKNDEFTNNNDSIQLDISSDFAEPAQNNQNVSNDQLTINTDTSSHDSSFPPPPPPPPPPPTPQEYENELDSLFSELGSEGSNNETNDNPSLSSTSKDSFDAFNFEDLDSQLGDLDNAQPEIKKETPSPKTDSKPKENTKPDPNNNATQAVATLDQDISDLTADEIEKHSEIPYRDNTLDVEHQTIDHEPSNNIKPKERYRPISKVFLAISSLIITFNLILSIITNQNSIESMLPFSQKIYRAIGLVNTSKISLDDVNIIIIDKKTIAQYGLRDEDMFSLLLLINITNQSDNIRQIPSLRIKYINRNYTTISKLDIGFQNYYMKPGNSRKLAQVIPYPEDNISNITITLGNKFELFTNKPDQHILTDSKK